MPHLTLLLYNWARKDNMRRLLDSLRSQTIAPRIFLWNNNPEPFRAEGIDWLINSSINNHCKSLAFLASQADTEFIGTMDDDILPADNKVFEDAIQVLASQTDPNRIVGVFGANLIEGRTYTDAEHIHIPTHDIPVDLVKGQIMLFRKSAIKNFPEFESVHVDLELSIRLAGAERRRHLLSGCFYNRLVELPQDGLGYSDKPTHYLDRDEICRKWVRSNSKSEENVTTRFFLQDMSCDNPLSSAGTLATVTVRVTTDKSAEIGIKPKVSIVTPFLNAGRYIEETIESVLAQTYDHWEFLLSDDGSTDESTEIAQRYAKLYPEKIRYLQHEDHQHRGESATRNLALRNATGEYIAFVDADDVLLPHKLEEQLAIMESQPEAGMIYDRTLRWYSWTGNADDVSRDHLTELDVPAGVLYRPPALLILFLQGKNVVPTTCSLLARREIVERIGGFADDFPDLHDDMVFYAKMFFEAPVFVSGGCSAKYRQHENMSTSVAFEKGEWHPFKPNPAQRKFLTWLESYLAGRTSESSEVWKILQKELWPYRHPVLYQLRGRLTRLTQRMKWFGDVVRRWVAGESVGFITANPNPIKLDEGPALGVTTLTWKSHRATDVEVRVGAPDGPLLSRSSGKGTAVTGKWVFDGEVFYLQDVSKGRSLTNEHTLATVTVNVIAGGRK